MTTGERIKAARKQAGMTQQELAEKLEISFVGVSQWESGRRNPKESTLARIADVLDVPLGYLTGSGFRGKAEIADFVNRAWPRADNHVKMLRETGEDQMEVDRWERVCAQLLEIRDEISATLQEEQILLSNQEKHLLEIFRSLNTEGRRKILAIIGDYAKIGKYSSTSESGD